MSTAADDEAPGAAAGCVDAFPVGSRAEIWKKTPDSRACRAWRASLRRSARAASSSALGRKAGVAGGVMPRSRSIPDRKSVVKGKNVSVRVDRGGRRIIKKKNKQENNQ